MPDFITVALIVPSLLAFVAGASLGLILGASWENARRNALNEDFLGQGARK